MDIEVLICICVFFLVLIFAYFTDPKGRYNLLPKLIDSDLWPHINEGMFYGSLGAILLLVYCYYWR